MRLVRLHLDATYGLLALLCLSAGVAGIVMLPSGRSVPENELAVGLLLLVVGPASFAFGALALSGKRGRVWPRYLLATIGYLLGVLSFFVMAVSMGRLHP